jgi:hypothetical protein
MSDNDGASSFDVLLNDIYVIAEAGRITYQKRLPDSIYAIRDALVDDHFYLVSQLIDMSAEWTLYTFANYAAAKVSDRFGAVQYLSTITRIVYDACTDRYPAARTSAMKRTEELVQWYMDKAINQ